MWEQYKEDFEKIISYSQAFPFDINCDDILKKWEKNKGKYLELWNNQTRVKSIKKLTFNINEKEKTKLLEKCIEQLQQLNTKESWVNEDTKMSLIVFLYLNIEGFFNNIVVTPLKKEDGEIIIPAGMKLVKSFKYFISNKKYLRKAQDIASEYIQKTKLEGYLYLSIDPIDFLLLSNNAENWGSCHQLDHTYRSGNLSLMCDRSTIIAFVADDEMKHIKGIPADMKALSKKWRMLLHYTPGESGVMWFSKPYPFELNESKRIFLQLFMENAPSTDRFYSPYEHNGLTSFKGNKLDCNHIYFSGELYRLDELIKEERFSLHYSDLKRSAVDPVFAVNKKKDADLYTMKTQFVNKREKTKFFLEIEIGAEVPCVCGCGNIIHDSNTFLCDECWEKYNVEGDYFTYCVCCGDRIYDDINEKIFLTKDNEILCKKCYNYSYNEEEF